MSQAQILAERRLAQKYPYKLIYWIDGKRSKAIKHEDFKTRCERLFRVEQLKIFAGESNIRFEYGEEYL